MPAGKVVLIDAGTAKRAAPAVMVVSHERSGTHFLMNSLAAAYPYPAGKFLNFDQPSLGINFFDPGSIAEVITEAARRARGIVIKSHHPVEFFEGVLPQVSRAVLILYIYRDPVEVMISCWRFMHHWHWHEGPRTATAIDYAAAEPEGQMLRYQMHQKRNMLHRWASHVDGWLAASKTNPRVVPVCYEALRDTYADTIGRLSALIGSAPASTVPPSRDVNVIKGAPPETLPAPDIPALRSLALTEVGDLMRRLGYA